MILAKVSCFERQRIFSLGHKTAIKIILTKLLKTGLSFMAKFRFMAYLYKTRWMHTIHCIVHSVLHTTPPHPTVCNWSGGSIIRSSSTRRLSMRFICWSWTGLGWLGSSWRPATDRTRASSGGVGLRETSTTLPWTSRQGSQPTGAGASAPQSANRISTRKRRESWGPLILRIFWGKGPNPFFIDKKISIFW